MTASGSRLYRLLARFEQPRYRGLALGLAIALVLSVVPLGLSLDDWVLLGELTGAKSVQGFGRGSWDLFFFFDGNPEHNRALMSEGVGLPWWTLETFKGALFRPLSSLTHALDAALWPSSAALMYLHSIAWLVVLCLLCWRLYDRLAGDRWIAGVATAMFALDGAHGQTTGWISNRNALLATTFVLVALIAHDRFRREGRASSAAAAAVSLGLAFLSGEFAVGGLAYLFAYAVTVESGSWRERVRSLLPYAPVALSWVVLYRGLGYGTRGSGNYIDPAADPLAFSAVLPLRATALLSSQLLGPSADFSADGTPSHVVIYWMFATLGSLAVLWLVVPLLRESRLARFWALGMTLSVVPVCATISSDRLLLLVSVGAMPLLAEIMKRVLTHADGAGLRLGERALGYVLMLLHFIVAPLELPLRTRLTGELGRVVLDAQASLPKEPSVADKTMIVLSVPLSLFTCYTQTMREMLGVPRPAELYWLAESASAMTIRRTAADTLRVKRENGFLDTPSERLFRDLRYPMARGQTVKLSGVTISIIELTPDNRPSIVDFRFERDLGDEKYLFARWKDGQFETVKPPAIGEELRMPAVTFVEALREVDDRNHGRLRQLEARANANSTAGARRSGERESSARP